MKCCSGSTAWKWAGGLLAGLGIVVLAVLFDRITQSYGQRMRMGGQR
ncbi:hypothetical protein BN2910_61300 [Achromobacter xylosoxidans]|nr:hypothetical protein BN2910_61300 [Achromobacter xylosoxidans]